eukprot:6664211-Pyramimonas_sp.AAC.1
MRKFYDFIQHAALARRLDSHGVARVAISFWIRETRRSQARVRLPGNALTDQIRRGKSLIQGDPAAPELSNVFLDRCLFAFHDLCRKNGWGLCLTTPGEEDEVLGVLSFADNFWILARSVSMAAMMTEAWLRILE